MSDDLLTSSVTLDDINFKKRGKADYVVKIPRPKKPKPVQKQEDGSEYIANLSDPEKEVSDLEFLRSKETMSDFDPASLEEAIKKKWGSFDVEILVDVLVKIGRMISGSSLMPYQEIIQRRIFRSILTNDGATITALLSRQAGKSHLTAVSVTTLCVMMPSISKQFPKQFNGIYDNGFFVGIFAPTGNQAKIIYDRVIFMSQTSGAMDVYDDPDIGISLERKKGHWSNGSVVIYQSADPRTNIEGFTAHLIILEESQDLLESVIEKCYDEDTPINLPDGTRKTIKSVVENRSDVLTPDGPIKPSKFINGGIQECTKITLSNGRSLTVSDNHINLVFKKSWRNRRGISKLTTLELWEEYNKKESVRLAVPQSLPYFGEIGNYAKGYVLGALLGDGCVRGTPHFCGRGESYRLFKKLVTSAFSCKINYEKYDESSDLYECLISRNDSFFNPLTKWLKELGVHGKLSHEKYVPNIAFSKEFYRGVIQALVETDGCVHNSPSGNPYVSYSSTSEKLAYDFSDILLKFGIHSFVSKRLLSVNNSKIFSRNVLYTVVIKDVSSLRLFNEQIGLIDKQNKLSSVIRSLGDRESRNYSKHYPDTMRFYNIVSMERVGLKQTYCVEVPTDDHLIIANGIISGNSIDPMGAWTNATTFSIGTCDENPCWFYDRICLNELRDLRVPQLIRNNYQFNYKEVIKHNPRYKKHVEKKIKEVGLESRYFQMKYGLRWFFEESRPVSHDDLKSFTMYTPANIIKYTDVPVVVGIDIAKEVNASVVTVGKFVETILSYEDDVETVSGIQVCDWLELEKKDFTEQRQLIHSFLAPYTNIIQIVIDSTGGGSVYLEQALLEWKDLCRHIDGFHFNAKSKNYLMNLFFEYFYTRRLIIPNTSEARKTDRHQQFYLQMVNLEKQTGNGFVYLGKNNREGSRDDFPDSLFMMLHAAELAKKHHRPIHTDAESVVNPFSKSKHPFGSLEKKREMYRRGGVKSIQEQRRNKLIRGNIA